MAPKAPLGGGGVPAPGATGPVSGGVPRPGQPLTGVRDPVRGPAASGHLAIPWTYPVFAPRHVAAEPGQTVAQSPDAALPLEQCFATLAGDDRRPLLILRECKVCNGTDEALLKAQADNEKTLLMLQWFHCVKLPVDVMTVDTHPFHALFAEESPPHLLVCEFDGGNLRPLESERSRTELWDALTAALERSYEKSPSKALKELVNTLDELDQADRDLSELRADLERRIEEKGPGDSKIQKLRNKVAAAEERLAQLQKHFRETSDLGLLARSAGAGPEAPDLHGRGSAEPARPEGSGAGARDGDSGS